MYVNIWSQAVAAGSMCWLNDVIAHQTQNQETPSESPSLSHSCILMRKKWKKNMNNWLLRFDISLPQHQTHIWNIRFSESSLWRMEKVIGRHSVCASVSSSLKVNAEIGDIAVGGGQTNFEHWLHRSYYGSSLEVKAEAPQTREKKEIRPPTYAEFTQHVMSSLLFPRPLEIYMQKKKNTHTIIQTAGRRSCRPKNFKNLH